MDQVRHRQDINGLRGVAVLLVMFNHLGLPWARAGFIGVDVFFVISGYLITTQIYHGLTAGTFSFKQFYLRRMRRILPALVCMLGVTTAAAYWLLLPDDLLNYAKSLLAAVGMVANVYYWKLIKLGYFSTDTRLLPLLHTWSLGVEEQFYFFWPLICAFLFKRFTLRICLRVIASLIIASFLLYYLLRRHENFAYYSVMTRGFELLAGAVLVGRVRQIGVAAWCDHVLSLLGLALIIGSACFLSQQDYPRTSQG